MDNRLEAPLLLRRFANISGVAEPQDTTRTFEYPYIGSSLSVALVTETKHKTRLVSNSSIAVSKTVIIISGNCVRRCSNP
jgi:hypothetical protein